MQLESQVLVREFNRRLRAALTSVPNHVRVEAALEVESHVEDVLSRRPSTLPEPEWVAQILSGFGTPEAYAAAIVGQLPPVQVVTVRSGLREVLTAGRDLMGGTGRLLLAVLRGSWRFGVAAVRTGVSLAGAGLRESRAGLKRLADWSAEPRAAAGRSLRGSRSQLRVTLRSAWRNGLRLGRAAGRGLLRLASALGQGLLRAGGTGVRLGRVAIQYGRMVLLAALRLALLAGLAALALSAFLMTLASALAPDLVGWRVYEAQQAVITGVQSLREDWLSGVSPTLQAQFAQTGLAVQTISLSMGLLLTGLFAYLVWSIRRRRGPAVSK